MEESFFDAQVQERRLGCGGVKMCVFLSSWMFRFLIDRKKVVSVALFPTLACAGTVSYSITYYDLCRHSFVLGTNRTLPLPPFPLFRLFVSYLQKHVRDICSSEG